MDRYARQTILAEIGTHGQNRLANASALVIGAGGLGCPALQYLAAAGVGRLGIADFDVVEESNLQRQILYTHDQIGQNKAAAARDRLHALNPEIRIDIDEAGLNNDNVEKLFNDYDIIIDGTDNFAAKYLINDAGVKFDKPVIYGAINKFEGQLSVFATNHGPCYRCLHPEEPKNHIPNCAEAGVIGAVAGIIGTAQAMEAIKLIVAHENLRPLIGEFFTINLADMRTRKIKLARDENCPVCSIAKNYIKLPLAFKKTIVENCAMIKSISAVDAKNTSADTLFIDVREREEWDEGHIEGALLAPLSRLAEGEIPDLPRDKAIILYCRSGQRSLYAAHMLYAKGFTDLANMEGGYLAWSSQAA